MLAADKQAWRGMLPKEEGEVLRAYCDATGMVIVPGQWKCVQPGPNFDKLIGNVSIGIGRNLYGKGISQTESSMLCSADQTDACLELDRLIPWWNQLDSVRQIVLADMAFNLGADKLVARWPHFLLDVRQGAYLSAAQEMRNSLWHTQVPHRADPLIEMMETGKLA